MHCRLSIGVLMAFVLAACGPANDAVLPTVAFLPTDVVVEATATPPPTIAPRSTLPPTFTPTTAPTAIPPTATVTPTLTQTVEPTSALGYPLDAPQNFPVNLTVRGGGFNIPAAPPPAVQYTYNTDIYRLQVAYNGKDGQTLTLVLSIQERISPGDYALALCDDTDGTIPNGENQCLSIIYTNTGIAAANVNGGALNLISLAPLNASLSADLAGTRLPNSEDTRYNADAPITLTLEVAGQASTN